MSAVVIVVTYSQKIGAYRVEGNAGGVFASEIGNTQEQALEAWRKATKYYGEVKR